MKSLSVRPASPTLRQKAAHCAASVQAVGMVKDCAVWSAESGPTAAAKAKADALNHLLKRILPGPVLPLAAVRLFATKLLQFLRDGAAGIKPTHLAIIFDKSENSFRREIYPPYKTNRSEPPAELVPQFPLMRATVRAFGMIPVEQDRYE